MCWESQRVYASVSDLPWLPCLVTLVPKIPSEILAMITPQESNTHNKTPTVTAVAAEYPTKFS